MRGGRERERDGGVDGWMEGWRETEEMWTCVSMTHLFQLLLALQTLYCLKRLEPPQAQMCLFKQPRQMNTLNITAQETVRVWQCMELTYLKSRERVVNDVNLHPSALDGACFTSKNVITFLLFRGLDQDIPPVQVPMEEQHFSRGSGWPTVQCCMYGQWETLWVNHACGV